VLLAPEFLPAVRASNATPRTRQMVTDRAGPAITRRTGLKVLCVPRIERCYADPRRAGDAHLGGPCSRGRRSREARQRTGRKSAMPRLVSIQVSLPREIQPAEAPGPQGGAWTTGFFKQPVAGAVWAGRTNLEGDGQGDRKHHGGPDKAVLAYAAAHYPLWRDELDVPDLLYGAFAENLTIEGLSEQDVCIGDTYAVGAVRFQVSQPRQPCWKIAARWRRTDLTSLVERSGRTGWYLRVLAEGLVSAGDELELIERPFAEWTVARATGVMTDRADREGAAALATCPLISSAWQDALRQRAAGVPA
jgi:MOSC domain-containing protein YiiM